MHILHIDSSITGARSVSRQLTAAVVERLKAADAVSDVTYIDLADQPPMHLSAEHLPYLGGQDAPNGPLGEDVRRGHRWLEQFLAADAIVIGAPLYNLTIPTQLKAWIDRIIVARKTFRYSEDGRQGMAGRKRLILVITRGDLFDPASPMAALEHGERYLRDIFAFIGLTDPEIIVADGQSISPDAKASGIRAATRSIARLAPISMPAFEP